MGNQHDMLQQRIRIIGEGLERNSEENVIFANDTCRFSYLEKINCLSCLPNRTLCV